MLGVVAGGLMRRSPTNEGSVPEGAVFHLDFVNEVYWAGGQFNPVNDVLGGNFDPSDIGPSGMSTISGTGNMPDAAGNLLADLLTLWAAGLTVVVEIEVTEAGFSDVNGTFLLAANGASYPAATLAAYGYAEEPNVSTEDWSALFATGSFPALGNVGVHRLGFTFYRDAGGGSYESASVVDGGTAATDTTAYNGPGLMTPTRFAIVHDGNLVVTNTGTWITRSITGYAAVDAAALSALTALA